MVWRKRLIWEEKGWFGKPDETFLHLACSAFLSGGAVPQTPGQGGEHSLIPLNKPPNCTVLLNYRDMSSVTFGGGLDAVGGLSGPLKGLESLG